MAKQFKDKYLVRFISVEPYDKLDIWNLEVLDIMNPVYPAYRDEVLNAYKEYERALDIYGTKKTKFEYEYVYDEPSKTYWYLISNIHDPGQIDGIREVWYLIILSEFGGD